MPNRSVRDVIANRKPFTTAGKTTIAAAARLMQEHNVGALMIVERGHLIGIFTERDALGPELHEFDSELVHREHISEVI